MASRIFAAIIRRMGGDPNLLLCKIRADLDHHSQGRVTVSRLGPGCRSPRPNRTVLEQKRRLSHLLSYRSRATNGRANPLISGLKVRHLSFIHGPSPLVSTFALGCDVRDSGVTGLQRGHPASWPPARALLRSGDYALYKDELVLSWPGRYSATASELQSEEQTVGAAARITDPGRALRRNSGRNAARRVDPRLRHRPRFPRGGPNARSQPPGEVTRGTPLEAPARSRGRYLAPYRRKRRLRWRPRDHPISST
jgi:hypothetical protein